MVGVGMVVAEEETVVGEAYKAAFAPHRIAVQAYS
jgi:hypothetical protein